MFVKERFTYTEDRTHTKALEYLKKKTGLSKAALIKKALSYSLLEGKDVEVFGVSLTPFKNKKI